MAAGNPGHRKDTQGAGADLTRGGAGSRCGVQEASRAGSGGCGRCHSAAAENGTQHNGDGGAQVEAEGKPAVSSPAVPELPGPDSRTDASGRSMRLHPLRRCTSAGGSRTQRERKGYGGGLWTNRKLGAAAAIMK